MSVSIGSPPPPKSDNPDDCDIELTGYETVEQLEHLYSEMCNRQKTIENQFGNYMSDDLKTETDLLRLLAELGGLHVLETDCRELDSALDFSASLGDKVTRQIKSLDKVQNRVAACLQRVEDIIDLKLCTDGVQQALQNEEFEQAAAHIHRFLKLDTEVLRMSVAAASVGDDDVQNDNEHSVSSSPPTSPPAAGGPSSLEASLKLLKEAEMKLKSIVRRQFDEAVRKGDVASVERFFKIFPLLKLRKEGLERFSQYLSAQLESNSKSLVRKIIDVDEMNPRFNVRFADAASMLLEEVARIIDVHRPLVETYYGPGNILDFVKVLQSQCDDQFKTLIDEFRQNRRFSVIFNQVEVLSKQSKKSFGNIDRPDSKQLDVILAEISLINVKVEQYVSFVKRRIESDLETAHTPGSELETAKKAAQRYVMSTQLVISTQEIIGQYVTLEEYLMREMVAKAIGIDTIEEDSTCSTVVDDVFFVIKKSLHRAICSSSIDIVCAMVNHACRLLDEQYVAVLKNRLRSASASVVGTNFDLAQAYSFMQSTIQTSRQTITNTHPSSAGLAIQGQGATSGSGSAGSGVESVIDTKALFAWCVALNNVDVSADYVGLLKSNVEDEVSKLFMSLSEQSRGKLDSCLSILSYVGEKLREIQSSDAQHFTHSAIRPKLKPSVDAFGSTEHNIREDEFAAYEAEDPWCQALIRQVDRLLHAIKPMLTGGNHDLIVKGVVSETALMLEKAALKMRFSKLGGMQLDKDIRKLVTYLTSITSWSIRDRFARLTQIATILSLEREAELGDYMSFDDSFAWRLTPTEIRQILALRVDFSAENIKKLKL